MIRHGHAAGGRKTPEYNVWASMVCRCRTSSHTSYKYYGARGINVCERWLVFENFLADMGPRPSARHSLERIDNNGNYEPDNVRWATTAQQARNRRNSRLVTWRGRTQTITDWEREIGLGRDTLAARLDRWPLDDAMTIAARERKRKLTRNEVIAIRGSDGTLAKIAERFGVSISMVSQIRRNEAWRRVT